VTGNKTEKGKTYFGRGSLLRQPANRFQALFAGDYTKSVGTASINSCDTTPRGYGPFTAAKAALERGFAVDFAGDNAILQGTASPTEPEPRATIFAMSLLRRTPSIRSLDSSTPLVGMQT
jgi:hypothetical protein